MSTSSDAYDQIRAMLPEARRKVYEALYPDHEMTGGELNHALGSGDTNPSWHRRAAELVECGVADYVRDPATGDPIERPCPISGYNAKVYRILPGKVPTKKPQGVYLSHEEKQAALEGLRKLWGFAVERGYKPDPAVVRLGEWLKERV